MHMKDLFVDAASDSGLQPILAGLQEVAQAAARRRSVLPSLPGAGASSVSAALDAASGKELLPEEGVSTEELYRDLGRLSEGAALVARPGWLGHMDPPPTWASVLGSASAAVLNNNMLMAETAPSFTRLEADVTEDLAREMGLGPRPSGAFTAGGSLANLLALAVAREEHLRRSAEGGTDRGGELSRLTVVASEDAHTSIDRAAVVLGLDPKRGVSRCATDADGRMDVTKVERAIQEAEDAGQRCFCLVATAGTTVLGAIDPLAALADVAASSGLWFHVDAAYGGPLRLSRRRRSLLEGIERADSVTVNPQKWLYVAKVCALALFSDRAVWQRATAGHVPYAMPGKRGRSRTTGQLEGTRPADVLKLWLSMRQMGRRGVERVVERAFRLTRYFAAEVRGRPFLRLAAAPQTNIVVFAWSGGDAIHAEARTAALQRRLLADADVFLSLPEHRGRRWLRAVLLNPFTDEKTINRLFEVIDAVTEELGPR